MVWETHFLILGLVTCLLLLLLAKEARATIVLFGKNKTLSYSSIDAIFTPPIPEAGILGEVHAAEPVNGCSALAALDVNVTGEIAFAIVQRGECPFDRKVQNCQNAGFTGVIVFNNDEKHPELITMSGNGTGITIYALFVSNEAGNKLSSLEGSVYVLPGYMKETWSIKWLILSVSIIVIIIVGALVTTLCWIRRHILAEAEKEAYNEKLLNDDDFIMNREFVPDDLGPEGLRAHDEVTDTDCDQSDAFQSEGPSDSDYTSDISNHTVPN